VHEPHRYPDGGDELVHASLGHPPLPGTATLTQISRHEHRCICLYPRPGKTQFLETIVATAAGSTVSRSPPPTTCGRGATTILVSSAATWAAGRGPPRSLFGMPRYSPR